MLIICTEKDLLCLNLEVSFPKNMILIEILRLNDNRLYDTPVNFAKLQFSRCSELLADVSFA